MKELNTYFTKRLTQKIQIRVSGKVVCTCNNDILTVTIYAPAGAAANNYTFCQSGISDEIFRGYTDSSIKAQQIIRAYEKWILSTYFKHRTR